jgi:hypothetical protein
MAKDKTSIDRFDQYRQDLLKLRDTVPRLVELLQVADAVNAEYWQNLDARLLPLVDPHLPLMVAVCGGANSGKSMFFNSFLNANLSPVRGDAGSTRRVLVAGHPAILERADLFNSLFEPFGTSPRSLDDPGQLMEPGPPLYITHTSIPKEQVLIDTPDFDTGTNNQYANRSIAREVLEACNVLIYVVTNATYNNLENTRFMREILTEAGMRKCVLVYRCSRTFDDSHVLEHLGTTAQNLYGARSRDYVLGFYRTDDSDAVAAGERFIKLCPVGVNAPELSELLHGLDPRQIRDSQIETTVKAFLKYVRQILDTSKTACNELKLYTGGIRLAMSHAVQQALTTVPIEKIMNRMNQIWLDTSPPYLKFFRGVGSVVGKPARLILSMVKSADDKDGKTGTASAVDPLAELRSSLIAAAAGLRDQILATELVAVTTAEDPQGADLIRLMDQIRLQRRLDEQALPYRRQGPNPGSVSLHLSAPLSSDAAREKLENQPWQKSVARIVPVAEEILNISRDADLNRELTDLVHEFRQQMSFSQRTRESVFASLSILPATLGMAYILSTGDPVGGSGIYAKLHGLFGMHDLWALVSIPATAGMDETSRKNLRTMLAPVLSRWFESRAVIVQKLFDENISASIITEVESLINTADDQVKNIESIWQKMKELNDE